MSQPKVSVVIPTHNSEYTIKECLESLVNQSISKENYEVIIVDDGSIDNTTNIVKQTDFELLEVEPCNVSVARNIGVKNAKGEIIAFMDSDCIADNYWLENIISSIQDGTVIIGSIENGRPKSSAGWTEYLLEFSAFSPNRKTEPVRWGPTCNMACTKDDFNKTGGFVDVNGSEDVLFGNSLIKNNVKIFFTPRVTIKHLCRTNLNKVLSHQRFLGKQSAQVRRSNPDLAYSFLGSKKRNIPLLFLSKLAARTFYAIQSRKIGRFISCFPNIVKGVTYFCRGTSEGLS